MGYFKARLLAVLLMLLSISLVYYNWHQLLQDRQYSVKLATFGPVVGIGGLFLMIFPSMAGKPTTAKEKIIVLGVLVVGSRIS